MARNQETTFQRAKALEVQENVERIYKSLRRANQTLFRAVVRSQRDIGSGHPTDADEKQTDLAGGFSYTNQDAVVMGLWYQGLKHAKYICGRAGHNIIRGVREALADVAADAANSWRIKKTGGARDAFLKEARRLVEQTREISFVNNEPEFADEIDMLRLQKLINLRFKKDEAECQLISYLMRHDVKEMVHFYSTHSPCLDCCEKFRDLEPRRQQALSRGKNVQTNPVAHPNRLPLPQPGQSVLSPAEMERQRWQQTDAKLNPQAWAQQLGISGLGWRIGCLFFGRLYVQAKENSRHQRNLSTDLRVLDQAIANQSIVEYEHL
jgi:hypothetical protein